MDSKHHDNRPAARWNAGQTGCAGLIIGLRSQMAALQSRECLELHTVDPGARVDIPAWCRLTGHTLVLADHPVFIIQKQGD